MPKEKSTPTPTPTETLPNGKPKPVPQKIRILDAVIAVLIASNVAQETIDKITEMKTTVSRGTPATDVVVKDDEGNVLFIHCSYHNKWEPLVGEMAARDEEGNETGEVISVENFGKAKTPYGYTRTCKEGAKSQNDGARGLRKQKDEITQNWLKGEIEEVEAKEALTELESFDTSVKPRTDGIGFDTKEDALASV